VIKPVAFKPVVLPSPGVVTVSTSQHYKSPPPPHVGRTTSGQCVASSSSGGMTGRRSTDDGYDSRGADANRSSSSDASQSSLVVGGTGNEVQDIRRGESPDVESAVRAKDLELRRLRETMEQNETAIMEVLQERRRSWNAQMAALNREWEHKLRCQQQASFRTEQTLLLQVFKLQQDNRCLRGRGPPNSEELRLVRARVDELQWELRERTAEVGALRAQLDGCSSQLDATRRDAEEEVAASRGDAHAAVERAVAAERRAGAAEDAASRSQRDLAVATDAVESLRSELGRARAAVDAERVDFERQREQWLDEKRRVIDYQKQLQLNYVQIARKNKLLEADVQQLTSEVEHHASVPSLNGGAYDQALC